MSDQLIQLPVPAALSPATPLILANAGFVATLALVESQVKDITVSDDALSQTAADLQVRLTTAGTTLEKQRRALKEPFEAFLKQIDSAARSVQTRIDAAKQLISTKNSIYLQDKRIREARAERERLAEIARLEQQRRIEAEAERNRIAAEEAKWAAEALPAATNEIDAGDDELPAPEVVAPTAVEQRIAELVAAPVKAVAAPSGVREIVTLVFTVTDVSKLADVFVTREPKTAAIRAAYCAGYRDGAPLPVVPGLAFTVQRSVQSTGRVQF